MESQISERKQLIAKRKRQFFAVVLGVLIAVMPVAEVMAETVTVVDGGQGQTINGKAVYLGEEVKWNVTGTVITTGRLQLQYFYNGACVDETAPSGLIDGNAPERTGGFSVNNRTGIADLDHWEVFGFQSSATCTDGSYEDVNGDYPRLTIKLRAVLKSKPEKKDDKKDDDDRDNTPFIYNPDAIAAYYYKKGARQGNAIIGKQKQTDMAENVFAANVPAGWHSAFSMSMSVDGKNEYSLKDGTIVLCVPDAYLKAGRQYAFLAMDKNGKVFKLDDEDKNPNTVTVTPNIEGYAYVLIYKD